MRNPLREMNAIEAARFVGERMSEPVGIWEPGADTLGATGIILGTGWGDTLEFAEERLRLPLKNIPGFESLEALEGHARELVIGCLKAPGNPRVVCLRGRVHMNESPRDPSIPEMVRLQVELMVKLGVGNLILTCAAGGTQKDFRNGDVAVINDFVAYGQDEMPLWVGEFVNPSSVISCRLQNIASAESSIYEQLSGCRVHDQDVNYCFWRGPHFESRRDKQNMADLGAHTVGMSMKPECCVAALYALPTLALAYLTNGPNVIPEHEKHLDSAREKAFSLGSYLTRIIMGIDRLTEASSQS